MFRGDGYMLHFKNTNIFSIKNTVFFEIQSKQYISMEKCIIVIEIDLYHPYFLHDNHQLLDKFH